MSVVIEDDSTFAEHPATSLWDLDRIDTEFENLAWRVEGHVLWEGADHFMLVTVSQGGWQNSLASRLAGRCIFGTALLLRNGIEMR